MKYLFILQHVIFQEKTKLTILQIFEGLKHKENYQNVTDRTNF